MSRLKEFQGIEGTNFFEQDRGLQLLLKDLLAEDDRAEVFSSLNEWGGLVAGRYNDMAIEANRYENLPRIVKYDRTGGHAERVDYGAVARQMRREVAEHGVLTETRNDLHRFAIVYLLAHNGEASVNCGLSCTDGLIRAVEAKGSDFLRDRYLPLLKSPDTPLAGAQFVTEQDGGSDVGAIEAEAVKNDDGTWAITGEKWFCSNPDEYFLVAARPRGARAGTAGVAVFLVPRVLPDGSLNRLSFKRLKDKLGTRSLPTAEIDFEGAAAYQIGETQDGFKTLMHYVINVSRMHNAANACGMLHRAFLEARNYARQRVAFGSPIINYPLIQETLVGLLEKLWRQRVLTFKLIALIDKNGLEPEDASLAMWQRFLVNLAKYRTAVTLTNSIREAILVFGGNGIVEDFTVLPRLLRDAMIIETWEGAHNTLCLQIMRDAAKSDIVERWRAEISSALECWPQDLLSGTRNSFEQAFKQALPLFSGERIADRQWVMTHARRVVDRMGDLLELAWMSELAARLANEDATAALLASVAGCSLLPGENQFEHSMPEIINRHAIALIEERSIQADVERN